MVYVVIAFLYLSILLYFVLGGADFGAGIIEMFTSHRNIKRTRKTLYHALGPIWEANHMWLIIAIVIMFVGFPTIYSTLSIYLHIPLTFMLLGIIARGTAFVFRHYDAVRDSMQAIYNRIFIWSSFVTPFFLGMIAASTLAGKIDLQASSFADAYIWSWLHWFSVAVGLFTVALCGFLASIYLIGEAESEEDRLRFVYKAKKMNWAAVVCGTLVFIAAEVDHVPLFHWIVNNPLGLASVMAASISLVILWFCIHFKWSWLIRILVGYQVTMILVAVGFAHAPDFILVKNGAPLSLLDYQAPEKTIQALGWALLLGSLFILPALFYLYYSFQIEDHEEVHA